MKKVLCCFSVLFLCTAAQAKGHMAHSKQSNAPSHQLTKKEIASAFLAAKYTLVNGKWKNKSALEWGLECSEGSIEEVRDLNQDGLPEVLITSEGTDCHGRAGTGFSLVSKSSNGKWKLLMDNHSGFVNFLKSTSHNWPDIEVGGTGFCFPVWRWNGQKYQVHRHQYEGKRCEP